MHFVFCIVHIYRSCIIYESTYTHMSMKLHYHAPNFTTLLLCILLYYYYMYVYYYMLLYGTLYMLDCLYVRGVYVYMYIYMYVCMFVCMFVCN